jgi:phenylalanyl-tRNA synthetase beta chain
MPWHPGRCARLALADGTLVGHAGELHPKVVAALGIPARTVGAELDLDVLTRAAEVRPRARPIATPPMAQSDVALVVGSEVPAATVHSALVSGGGALLESVQLFDVYEGDQVGPGNKSLAYRLTFRSPERTLTTDEVSTMRDAAVAAAADAVGAVQRA